MTLLEEALAHGLAQHRAGQLTEARSVYEALLSHCHDPNIHGTALSHLAHLHLNATRLSDAREAADRALRIDGSNGTALLAAARVERVAGHPEKGLATLQTRSTHHLPPALLHELGLCWHAMGEFRKAFLAFKEAKRRISFTNLDVNRGILTRYMERLAARFDGPEEQWTPTPALDRASPVFLVGFKESGVEELGAILGAHPGFGLTREAPAMDAARRSIGGKDPDGLHTLTEEEILRARTKYFEVIDQRVSRDCIPVDAMPFNMIGLALIHRLFPEALILRCVRHPCEATLRAFLKPYELNAVTCHFDRLERTATTLMATTAISAQIEDTLGLTVHPLKIEEFLASPHETAAAIASGVGLDPHADLAVTPMSTLDQWPKYSAEMSRWLTPLTDLAEALGYPAK